MTRVLSLVYTSHDTRTSLGRRSVRCSGVRSLLNGTCWTAVNRACAMSTVSVITCLPVALLIGPSGHRITPARSLSTVHSCPLTGRGQSMTLGDKSLTLTALSPPRHRGLHNAKRAMNIRFASRAAITGSTPAQRELVIE